MAVNCAILSYNGMVYFGFSGDVHAAPDLWRWEKFVKQNFVELRDAAGATAPRKKAERKKRAPVKKQRSKTTTSRAGTAHVPIPVPAVRSSSESEEAPVPRVVEESVLVQSVA
jgi:hypothetical protein